MFTLNNVTHRNTITEADYFITHITNKQKTNAKILQNRYHCQVLVDLNKCKQKHYGTTYKPISTGRMVHEEHKGLGKTENNISTFSEVCQV